MTFELRGETVVAAHSLPELKRVYRALHGMLSRDPELMDTHFMIELQRFLQARAMEDGVDTTLHRAWDAWLADG